MPTPQQLSELFAFLQGSDAPLSEELSLEFIRGQWLGPLLSLRLGNNAHPYRDACLADFNQSFQRKELLLKAWHHAGETLNAAKIEHLTLGSLPFSDTLFGHPAAKLSQDIDLLVTPSALEQTFDLLTKSGWSHRAPDSFLTLDGVQLDLHATPGEEVRFPTIAEAYGLDTATLLAHKQSIPNMPNFAPREDHLLDLRVTHFFKHYCSKLIDALEIALLLEQCSDVERLRATVVHSRSGRVWAFVLALLKRWGLNIQCDPTTPSDKAFVARPKVQRILNNVAALKGGRSPLRLTAMMLPFTKRLRFACELGWPKPNVITRALGNERPPQSLYAGARMRRLFKALGGALRGR